MREFLCEQGVFKFVLQVAINKDNDAINKGRFTGVHGRLKHPISKILLCAGYSTDAVASKAYMGMERVRIEELISSKNQQEGVKLLKQLLNVKILE